MRKVIYIIVFFVFFIVFIGCGKSNEMKDFSELDVTSEGILSWNNVSNASSYDLKFGDDVVNTKHNSYDLKELNLRNGRNRISINAKFKPSDEREVFVELAVTLKDETYTLTVLEYKDHMITLKGFEPRPIDGTLYSYQPNNVINSNFSYSISRNSFIKDEYTCNLYSDKDLSNEISNISPLEIGDNYYYLGVYEDGKVAKKYRLNIYVLHVYTVTAYDYYSGEEYNQNVEELSSPSVPDVVFDNELVFDKWVNSNGDEVDFSSPIKSDTSLYAKYNDVDVEVDLDGGSLGSSLSFPVGYYGKVIVPTKEGSGFVGWFSNDLQITNHKGKVITLYTKEYRFTELKAKWIESVTLSLYDTNDLIDSIDVGYGDSISLPALTKDGFIFLGWYYNEESDEVFISNANGKVDYCDIIENKNIYAKWYDYNDARSKLIYTIDHNDELYVKGVGEGFSDTTLYLPSVIDGYKANYSPHAFTYLSVVTDVYVEGGVKELPYNIFANCVNLKNVYLPDSLKSISEKAFLNCSSLVSINIPNGITRIEQEVFANCTKLANVKLPDYLSFVENSAFFNTPYAEENPFMINGSNVLISYIGTKDEVVIPNTVTMITDRAFSNSPISKIVIPDSVLFMGEYVFDDCDSLTTVKLSNSLTTIPNGTFISCDYLTDIEIPSSINTIGLRSFLGCYSLESIVIPTSVTIIESEAFSDCRSLMEVDITTEIMIGDDVFFNTPYIKFKDFIFIGDNVLIKYVDDSEDVFIPENTKRISNYAFYNNDVIETVNVSNSVTSIGDYAFYNCNELKDVTIPLSVTSLGSYAFYSCYSLTNVTLGSITEIKDYTFSNCSVLKYIELPSTVIRIGNFAFEYCYNLETVYLSRNLISIGESVFKRCDSLEDVFIPISVTTIGSSVFSTTNMTIYSEAKVKPDGWADDWKTSFVEVVWDS